MKNLKCYDKHPIETRLEGIWDTICMAVGFDEKGKEIQEDIREFVRLKIEEESIEKHYERK